MVMNVRDEEDILDANLRAHLALGVDFFVLVDHRSSDSTPEILRRYADAGLADVSRDTTEVPFWKREDAATNLARRAATEHGADWVIHNDADEFWWPLAPDLKAALEQVPERYHALLGPRVEFVARPDGPGEFWERLTVRERFSRVQPKIAHRAHQQAYIPGGVHRVAIPGTQGPTHVGRASLRTGGRKELFEDSNRWTPTAPVWPIQVFHYPLRSSEHFRRRVELGLFETGRSQRRADAHGMLGAYESGELERLYANMSVSDAEAERGLASGELVEDERLRELLDGCPDFAADPGALEGYRPPAPGPEVEERLADNAQDAMQAMWRSEALAEGRAARAKERSSELNRELKQLRRTPLRRMARPFVRLVRRRRSSATG